MMSPLSSGPAVRPGRDVPLFGRDEELGRLCALLRDPRYAGAVVAGPSGIGRTRLVDEAASWASEHGWRPMRVGGSWPNRHSLLLAATDRVLGAGDQRHLLLVDDAQLLDVPTAGLLLQLARMRWARLVVGLNTDRPAPGPVTELWKEEYLGRVELGPLDSHSGRRLVRALTDDRLDYRGAMRLAWLARGNPQLLRELLHAAVDRDALTVHSGRWSLRGGVPVSPRLAGVVGARLAELSEPQLRGLELVALSGPAPVDHVELMVGADELRALEERELVEAKGDEGRWEVSIRHPLVAEVLRERMPALRRRQLVSAWVAASEQVPPSDERGRLRVAGWRLELGQEIEEETLIWAAQAAYLHHDLPVAQRFAHAAWTSHGTPDAAICYANVLIGLVRHDEAERVLCDAVESHGDACGSLRFARSRNALVSGRISDAMALLENVEDPRRAADLAFVDYATGRPAAALEKLAPLLAVDSPTPDVVIVAMASFNAVGRSAESLAVYERITARHRRSPSECNAFAFHHEIFQELACYARAAEGDLAEAIEHARTAFESAVGEQRVRVQAQRAVAFATVLLDGGRVRQTYDLLPSFGSQESQWARWSERALHMFMTAAAQLGEEEACTSAAESIRQYTPGSLSVFGAVATAWHMYVSSRQEDARDLLLTHARQALASRAYGNLAMLVHTLGRLGMAADAGQLGVVRGEGLSRFVRARLDYCRAIADADEALLTEIADVFERADARLYAAEALAELAASQRRTGQGRRATATARRARSLAERCQGARTPALCLVNEIEALSRREQEVVELAVRGLTDPQIAARLGVSVRTVNNHLYRAYQKLGACCREELDGMVWPQSRQHG
ncbi:helix-turn-helix transcriptional regulator [Allokutzneria oryzae]|uniref:LuxR C-terminal-related transcriptional regulator n=1 Tax=Allokutzneria oryzae TaxID=1378989 RepID=A0ABV5ZYL4_9PSEU